MKEVRCLKCNRKLAEIEGLQIKLEKDVFPLKPKYLSLGIIIMPFECPICQTIQSEPILMSSMQNNTK